MLERRSLLLSPPSASSHWSILGPISNCGQRIVTLWLCLPGICVGVARVILTRSKSGFLRVRRKWVARRAGRAFRSVRGRSVDGDGCSGFSEIAGI